MDSCTRCQGLLVRDEVRGRDFRFEGFRCMNCGSVTDALIVQNRTNPPVVNNRAEPRYATA
jgi:hypothetical protein